MKVRYIKEGYFKNPEQLKADAEKRKQGGPERKINDLSSSTMNLVLNKILSEGHDLILDIFDDFCNISHEGATRKYLNMIPLSKVAIHEDGTIHNDDVTDKIVLYSWDATGRWKDTYGYPLENDCKILTNFIIEDDTIYCDLDLNDSISCFQIMFDYKTKKDALFDVEKTKEYISDAFADYIISYINDELVDSPNASEKEFFTKGAALHDTLEMLCKEHKIKIKNIKSTLSDRPYFWKSSILIYINDEYKKITDVNSLYEIQENYVNYVDKLFSYGSSKSVSYRFVHDITYSLEWYHNLVGPTVDEITAEIIKSYKIAQTLFRLGNNYRGCGFERLKSIIPEFIIHSPVKYYYEIKNGKAVMTNIHLVNMGNLKYIGNTERIGYPNEKVSIIYPEPLDKNNIHILYAPVDDSCFHDNDSTHYIKYLHIYFRDYVFILNNNSRSISVRRQADDNNLADYKTITINTADYDGNKITLNDIKCLYKDCLRLVDIKTLKDAKIVNIQKSRLTE